METQSYKDLIVWQRGIELVKEIYRLTEEFPKSELFGLVSQMRRSAVSIPSNIAEGYKRKNLGEYIQFLSIADGSAAELETQIIISKALYKSIDSSKAEALIEEVQKMLVVMIRKLSAKRYPLNAKSGQALIELLLAVTLGALFLAAAAIAISSLLLVSAKNRDFQTALGLATELSNNVKTMADQNWQSVFGLTKGTSTRYYISTTSSVFSAVSGTETTALGGVTFSRYFSVTAVSCALCGGGAVTTTDVAQCASGPGAVGVAEDAASQNIYVYVSKVGANGAGDIALMNYSQLITRSRNKILRQTDWSGGSGQEGPYPSGLIGYWPLDEGSGTTTADVSGYGNSGTLTGGPTWNSLGKVNNAVSFDGANDYVGVSFTHGTPFSYSAWIYSSSTSGNIVEERIDSGDIAFYIESSQLRFGWWRNPETELSGGSINQNTWTYVAGTWDGTTRTIYVNGTLVGQDTPLGPVTGGALNWKAIGRADTGGGWSGGLDSTFNGTIDDVRIYNRALSSSEVSALYVGTFPYLNSKFSTSTNNVNYSSTTGSITMVATSSVIASTSLISSVFDTGTAAGSAYKINSILWQGTQPAGATARFQLATSDNASGTWSYMGYDGTNSTYYTAAPNTAIQIARAYSDGQRFFRYKIFLTTTGNSGPTVDDIVVNWGL